MVESAITSKGQTMLPKPVRTALGVGEGDRVRYVILEDEVRIRPVRPISRLYGLLRRPRRHARRNAEGHGARNSRRRVRGMIALDTNVIYRFLYI